MAQEKPVFDYHEESHSEKLARKSKESPFMVVEPWRDEHQRVPHAVQSDRARRGCGRYHRRNGLYFVQQPFQQEDK
ncbi:hypothetical protein OBRU01_15983 [Operophtera brumata]|uniref:Uncharacterized protein n=1 Tax=Operophtera brumata TaxID=104452 RepID=A0A0L7KYV8_OPEBR|nr:hypothetical protein OBRU01_15983 [Operophtera brumata]